MAKEPKARDPKPASVTRVPKAALRTVESRYRSTLCPSDELSIANWPSEADTVSHQPLVHARKNGASKCIVRCVRSTTRARSCST